MDNPTETRHHPGLTVGELTAGQEDEKLHDATIAADSSATTKTNSSEERPSRGLVEKDKPNSTNASGVGKSSGMDSLYRSIEAYDWANDKVYQRALQNMAQSTDLSPYELEARARCFYWSRKTKSAVDFASYKNWKIAEKQDSFNPPNPKDSMSPSVNTLLKELTLTADSNEPSNINQMNPEEPPAPYPQNFQEVAEMITSGRGHLLPGIKEIPPVVLTDKITAPTIGLRKKPWESGNCEPPAVQGGMFGDRRDIYIRQEE